MAITDENYNVRRIQAVDRPTLESELTPKMIGFEVSTKSIGAMTSVGDMQWYPSEGSEASFSMITDEELAGVGTRPLAVDSNGKLVEGTNPSLQDVTDVGNVTSNNIIIGSGNIVPASDVGNSLWIGGLNEIAHSYNVIITGDSNKVDTSNAGTSIIGGQNNTITESTHASIISSINSDIVGTGGASIGSVIIAADSGSVGADYCLVGGINNTSNGDKSVVFGDSNTVSSNGNNSIIQGSSNATDAHHSLIIGTGNQSIHGNNHYVFGDGNTIGTNGGAYFTAFGNGNTLDSGSMNVAFGSSNTASQGTGNIAFGTGNTLHGNWNLGGGDTTLMVGNFGFAYGSNLSVSTNYAAVFGQYNVGAPGLVFEVGGGTSSARTNLMEINSTNKEALLPMTEISDITGDKSITTKEYVDSKDRFSMYTLTPSPSGTVTLDISLGNLWTTTPAADIDLADPINMVAGDTMVLEVDKGTSTNAVTRGGVDLISSTDQGHFMISIWYAGGTTWRFSKGAEVIG